MRVLVTGATDGIGEEIARQMAGRGARVIVHGRSAEKAEAAAERTGAAEIAVADLASFAQVRAMADGLSGSLDGLVNNAGIGYGTAPPRNARTEDGHEPTWQVNFLSAFLLTELLRERLRGGRVVHVSSGVHSSGSVDLERPDEPRYATPYAQSKIALVMLAREQGERWARDGGPAVNACSPGWIATKMGGAGGGDLADGADTPVWMLTDPSLEGVTGRYFWQRREEEPNPQTNDETARRRLVELARAATGR
ncbi:MAG TPA: SDR family NAD(P)-dependent oxidoreductase [Solirubrobacteraceae bacterium]|jgi:NAD(P)-dependent dehydrogenase (short-subunit alcohol dehydrogenase family)|nr:SDR family NAD(P)-dependent oxidoreductase [Solirubrobacteraceae bacterium]